MMPVPKNACCGCGQGGMEWGRNAAMSLTEVAVGSAASDWDFCMWPHMRTGDRLPPNSSN
jgi:hypothetical protein